MSNLTISQGNFVLKKFYTCERTIVLLRTIVSLSRQLIYCISSSTDTASSQSEMFSHAKNVIVQIGRRSYGKLGIVGVPFEAGQEKVGVARGPHVIRAAGLVKELESLGIDVRDYGDLSYEAEDVAVSNMSHMGHFAGCTKCLSDKVQQVLNDGRQVLTLGGDHSLSVGSVDAHVKVKKDVAVLWIDAHADLNTNATSESGNVHGMPVALLTKELSDYWPYLPGMDWQKPVLSIRNVGYIGLRSVDRYERLVIEKFGINAYGIRDVERYGIHDVVHMALSRIDPDGKKSIHVSFDIDSLDPLEAPSTGTPVRGGLALREGIHLMEEVYNTGRLNAVDLVEVNPQIGTERDVRFTVEAAIQIIQAAFGYNRRGLKVPEGITDIPLQTFK